MLATLFAERVILGKTKFDEVPEGLKGAVADILKQYGVPYLITGVYTV